MKRSGIALCLLIALASCYRKPYIPPDDHFFEYGHPLGEIDPKLKEASGLAMSRVNENMLWSVNDSGNGATVFLIDPSAQIRMTCSLKGVKNRDWEELFVADGPVPGKSYVYVGDIGDNFARHKTKLIYRFEEPVFDAPEKQIDQFETLIVKLSDEPRDTEAMLLDPLSKALFLISKREDSVLLYKVNAPFTKDTLIAQPVTALPFSNIVGAAISADGKEVLVKDYTTVFYWRRDPKETIEQVLLTTPAILPYWPEGQGESLCFAHDSTGYYTLAESSVRHKAQLMFYKRK